MFKEVIRVSDILYNANNNTIIGNPLPMININY